MSWWHQRPKYRVIFLRRCLCVPQYCIWSQLMEDFYNSQLLQYKVNLMEEPRINNSGLHVVFESDQCVNILFNISLKHQQTL